MAVKATLDLDQAIARLNRMTVGVQERMLNLDPVLRKRARLLDGIIQKGFRASESPFGDPWKPLAKSTVDRRRKGSKQPLVDRGQLRKSVVVKTQDGEAIVFGLSGAPATYGPVHQFGTSRAGRKKNTKIPRRAFLPIDASGETSFSTGPAKKWLEDTKKAVVEYVLHGKR